MTERAQPPAPFCLDRALLRRRSERAAAHYDQADFLPREIARRMDERLDYIRIIPRRILDLGCATGADLVRLGERYPAAERIGIDFAAAMLAHAHARFHPRRTLWQRLRPPLPSPRLIAADAHRLPLPAASVSLAWSNLTLPATDEPQTVFAELHRVLETGGLLMFSTFGPDTLRELRAALPAHDGERVHRFIDMHDLGDALVKTGFADPVMDMEMLTLTYPDLDALLADLRMAGAANAAVNRPRGLAGRHGWAAARENYACLRHADRLPASIEIIQGHAWKTPTTVHRPTPDDRAIVHFHPRRPAN
ncbi:MAG: methyltransferase domain-containing protein [Azoarcus sp.]|nr:methyltransferase domain-containing protein [Azoarcus sp.]